MMAYSKDDRLFSKYPGVILLLVAVMIGGSVWGIYMAFRKEPTKYREVVICDNCKHVFEVEFEEGENSPFVCEECGEKQAYMAFICRECKTIFPNKMPESETQITCPNPYCHSTNVEQYLPRDGTGKKKP